MADRPVSIPTVAFAGLILLRRHWATALGVLAMAEASLLTYLAMPKTPLASTVLLVMLFGGFGFTQWLIYRALLTQGPKRAVGELPAWPAQLGRILLVTFVWLAAVLVVGVLAVAGLTAAGVNTGPSFYNWAGPGLFLFLLAIGLFQLGFAAAAGFERGRWLLMARPPAWPDLWRILLAYLLVAIQVVLIWWLIRLASSLLTGSAMRSGGLAVRTYMVMRVAVSGLSVGLSELLIVAAWAQAWRGSLGRSMRDPAAIFD